MPPHSTNRVAFRRQLSSGKIEAFLSGSTTTMDAGLNDNSNSSIMMDLDANSGHSNNNNNKMMDASSQQQQQQQQQRPRSMSF